MLEKIREASRNALVLCFAGVGSAFAKKNDQTSLIVAKDGTTILVDIGTTIPQALAKRGVNVWDFDYYHFTHSHADHIGGVEELLLTYRYVLKRKPKVIITEMYQDILWEKSLKGGCEYNEAGLLRSSDLMEPVRPGWMRASPREMYHIRIGTIDLVIFHTIHIPGDVTKFENAFWSTGLLIDGRVLFTADTRFDPELFEQVPMHAVETIFHDCQLFAPGSVHAPYEDLKSLPEHLKNRMWLTHYQDSFEKFDPMSDGFLGFARAWDLHTYPRAEAPVRVQEPQAVGANPA